jgi:peptidyl-prolyl cis-trans isomerase D
LELSPDHYLVLRMKEYLPAEPRPLDEVKATIVAAIKQQRAVEEVKSIAEQLTKQVKQGEDFEKVASTRGYALRTAEKAARNNGAINPELLRAAFALPKAAKDAAQSIDLLELSSGDVAILQLQAVVDGVPDSLNAGQRDALLAQLQQSFGTAGFAAFMEDTRARAEIKRR